MFDNAILKVPDPLLLILARPNQLDHPRIGFVISKKNVRRAVNRNKVRRIIRESFRLHQHTLPAVDIVILARKGVGDQSKDILHQAIAKCWYRLNKKSRNLKLKQQ